MVDDDPEADRAALAALAAWCERYSPLAAADPPDGLFIDITGCAHLFGDEVALAADLAARLERNALTCRIAVAGTPGAAWALARSATARETCTILPPGAEKKALAVPSRWRCLRGWMPRRTVAGAAPARAEKHRRAWRASRCGEISGRFGPLPMLRLDQAFGAAAEALAWPRAPAPWAERLAFAEPIGTAEDFSAALAMLAQRLCARLEAGQRGGHRFVAEFFRVDDQRPRIDIATARPVRDAAYVAKLLGEKLEKIDPGFGVDAMVLEVGETAPLVPPQRALAEIGAPPAPDFSATLDALANRLGAERLWRAAPHDSRHVPERRVRRAPPLASAPAWESDPAAERPLRLLRSPEPIEATAPVPDDPPVLFRWRGALHRVRAASGPERIAAEWWRRTPQEETRPESDLIRDYYRVEDTDGARFWIFRAGLQGMPRWFLHGLFA